MVLEGEPTLGEDEGGVVLGPGDCAAFPAGAANGHHLVDRSGAPGRFLVIGRRASPDVAHSSDVDMVARLEPGPAELTRRDGSLP